MQQWGARSLYSLAKILFMWVRVIQISAQCSTIDTWQCEHQHRFSTNIIVEILHFWEFVCIEFQLTLLIPKNEKNFVSHCTLATYVPLQQRIRDFMLKRDHNHQYPTKLWRVNCSSWLVKILYQFGYYEKSSKSIIFWRIWTGSEAWRNRVPLLTQPWICIGDATNLVSAKNRLLIGLGIAIADIYNTEWRFLEEVVAVISIIWFEKNHSP